jgi:hypothetical protein
VFPWTGLDSPLLCLDRSAPGKASLSVQDFLDAGSLTSSRQTEPKTRIARAAALSCGGCSVANPPTGGTMSSAFPKGIKLPSRFGPGAGDNFPAWL